MSREAPACPGHFDSAFYALHHYLMSDGKAVAIKVQYLAMTLSERDLDSNG